MGRIDDFIQNARRMATIQGQPGAGINGSRNVTTPFDFARQRVARAEAELAVSREAMRDAADAAGIERAGLFSESLFISRASAEKWTDRARSEGHAAGKQCAYEELTRVFFSMRGISYKAALEHAQISIEATRAQSKRDQAKLRASGFFDAVQEGDLVLAGMILQELFPAGAQSGRRSADTARAILTAAARARSDGANERPSPEGLAAQIVAAGKKRRGDV